MSGTCESPSRGKMKFLARQAPHIGSLLPDAFARASRQCLRHRGKTCCKRESAQESDVNTNAPPKIMSVCALRLSHTSGQHSRFVSSLETWAKERFVRKAADIN